MTTDMVLTLIIAPPVLWFLGRGEFYDWQAARREAKQAARERLLRELRHH